MLKQIQRFMGFSLLDKAIVTKATVLLIFIRLGLKFVSLKTLRQQLAKVSLFSAPDKPLSVYKIIWSITTASSYMPQVKCLARGLAAQTLLQQQGYTPILRIGVTKGANQMFAAHAWVECKGKVVMGGIGNSIRKYRVMPIQEFEQLGEKKVITSS
ncbi:MAG: lasso peptide biosynthesis B2 protein [Cyanobacteria bacterium J06631_2]